MKNRILTVLFLCAFPFSYAQLIEQVDKALPARSERIPQDEHILRLQVKSFAAQLNKYGVSFMKDFHYKKEDGKAAQSIPDGGYINISINVDTVHLSGDTAMVGCSYCFQTGTGATAWYKDIFIFGKERDWILKGIGNLPRLVKKHKNEMSPANKPFENITPIKLSANLFTNVPVLVPIFGNPVWEINDIVTRRALGITVIAGGLAPDGTIYSSPAAPDSKAAIAVDRNYKRLVYGNDEELEIKFYGGESGEQTFEDPVAVDVNEFGEVFVADFEGHCIYKFIYNYETNTIGTLGNPVFIGGLSQPSDVSYYSNGTPNDNSDDRILVADYGSNHLYLYDHTGQLLKDFTSCKLGIWSNSPVIQIRKPLRAILFNTYEYGEIAYIDGGSNTLICGPLTNQYQSNMFVAHGEPAILPVNSRLFDLGSDYLGKIFATDLGLNLVHKFNHGDYICSSDKFKTIYESACVSNLNGKYPVANTQSIYTYFSNAYGMVSGVRKYLPGADVVDLSNQATSSGYQFNFTHTSLQHYYVQLIDVANSNVIMQWGDAGVNKKVGNTGVSEFLQVEKTVLPHSGLYKWQIAFRPIDDESFSGYDCVGWKTQGLTFLYNPPPPPPPCYGICPAEIFVYEGDSKTISCGIPGATSYTWRAESFPQGTTFTPDNSTATITFSGKKAQKMGDFEST
ncbi:MAG: hypothetical protein HY965_03100, partial [Ignavibacteriales bacterium]|nr:hypothetical protein [Ignavibacteriales bacterium]